MKRLEKVGKHFVADPKVCHGKLTFKRTRVPVDTVLTFLGMGHSVDDILRNWPELSREAVEEAIRLGAELVQRKYPAKRGKTRELAHI